jgi:transcriptional regulator GlxA family with amidase domain
MRRRDNPQFIGMEVWNRATYYSCTQKAVEHIEKSFERPLGLRELAAIACMERTTFSKTFKHKTGVTLREFIQAYRISQATAMMEVSDYSLTEIAFGVGFGSLDTFERNFKKIAGTTPSQYRLGILLKNNLLASMSTNIRD